MQSKAKPMQYRLTNCYRYVWKQPQLVSTKYHIYDKKNCFNVLAVLIYRKFYSLFLKIFPKGSYYKLEIWRSWNVMASSKKSRDISSYFGIFERSCALPYLCKALYPGLNWLMVYDGGPFCQPLPLGYLMSKNF